MIATEPMTIGMLSVPGIRARSSAVSGASVAPKSTTPSIIWRMPPPEPTDW